MLSAYKKRNKKFFRKIEICAKIVAFCARENQKIEEGLATEVTENTEDLRHLTGLDKQVS